MLLKVEMHLITKTCYIYYQAFIGHSELNSVSSHISEVKFFFFTTIPCDCLGKKRDVDEDEQRSEERALTEWDQLR